MQKKKQKIMDYDELVKSIPNYLSDEVVPTNIYVIDKLLNGGVTLGNTIQIVGESGCGKSSISLLIARAFCMQGKRVLYLDTENSISMEMISAIDLDKFLRTEFHYLRLSTFEEVEEKLDNFLLTNEISLVIVDSLPGMLNGGFTNIEDKKISITKSVSSYNSRPLGMFMNKYKVLGGQKKVAFIYTNQFRNKIDITGNTGTHIKEYGGKNTRHNSDSIIKMSACKDEFFKNISKVLNDKYYRGFAGTFELIKSNKRKPTLYPFYLAYAIGFSPFSNYIYALKKLDIIKQAGSYYSIQLSSVEIKENGLENLIERLKGLDVNPYDVYTTEINHFYEN